MAVWQIPQGHGHLAGKLSRAEFEFLTRLVCHQGVGQPALVWW